MKLNKHLLWAFLLIVILSLCWMNSSSISTVLLGIKGTITDGNLIRFSGVTGVGEDAGVAALNVTKNKFDATIAPTVNNDIDEGYVVGSKWYDVTADKGYVCLDNTDGVAVWTETTSQGTTEFTGLTDTPANYTGEAGKYAKVNVGEDALEFGTVTGETNTASNIGAEIEIYKQKTGVDLEFRTLKANSTKISISNPYGADIDVGSEAVNGDATLPSAWTHVDKNNPANKSGVITSVEIWATTTLSDCEVATFYLVSGSNYSTRDYETIGTVNAGSKQTFSVNLDVQTGDFIGIYFTTGTLERSTGKVLTLIYASGDRIPCTDYTLVNSYPTSEMSVKGIGGSAVLDYVLFDIVEGNVKLDDLGTPDDNTDNDASTTAHGLMPKLPFSGDLLSTTTVAFNADADTTLYTVPTGKRCILSHAIIVAAGDAGATTTLSIGQDTAETDFIPANTLSNLDAQYDTVILQPVPNTTPLKIKSYVAATVIQAQVATQSGAAGNTVYLFGILY